MNWIMCVTVLYSAACVGSSPTGLADFNQASGGVTAYVMASQVQSDAFEVAVELRNANGDCPQIGDDVTASFNGQPMQIVERAGVPSFAWPAVTSATTNLARLAPGASPTGSTIVLADHTATWTVETPDLLANDFVIDPDQPQRVTWQSASRIWEDAVLVECVPDEICDALNEYTGLAIADNVLTGPTSGPVVTRVYASADFDTKRCDGPATCNTSVYDAWHTF